MQTASQIKSISYLKNNAAKVAQAVAESGRPMFITQNGEASMVIEDVARHHEKEELIALLKIIALGEADREAGKGHTLAESRAMLAARMQGR